VLAVVVVVALWWEYGKKLTVKYTVILTGVTVSLITIRTGSTAGTL
jgi:hypothetical protein